MARIRIDDLPLLQELGQQELQGIYGEGLFPGERLRQLAAAATLGITLASAPFAVAGNQGKGPGGGQGGQGSRGGASGQSQGPARTGIQVQIQHGVQPSQFRQQDVRVAWQGGSDRSDWHRDGDRSGYQHSQHVASFCQEHGTKFSHGFYYVGRIQKHFTERWYDARFETYLYFDPYAGCPYYWCEAHGVFYPIDYIETVGPGAKGPGPIVGGGPAGGPVVGGGQVGGGGPIGGGGGGPGGAQQGGAQQGGGQPVGNGSAAGPGNGAPVGGVGGAPGGGAQEGGGAAGGAVAPTGGAVGGAPLGGGAPAGDDSAAGSQEGAADGAAAGGAGGAAPGAAPGAPSGGAGGAGVAPAKPVGAPSGVALAQNRAPVVKKELQKVPAGTFDEAIPDEPN